jgi:hypothetical protein
MACLGFALNKDTITRGKARHQNETIVHMYDIGTATGMEF